MSVFSYFEFPHGIHFGREGAFHHKNTKKDTKGHKESRDLSPKNLCGFCVLLCVFCGHLTLDHIVLARRTSLLIRSLRYLPAAAFADAGPAVVSQGRVVEVGHAAPGLVNQPPDARHLLEVDLFDAVGVVVIVGMKSRREEDNWNAFGGVAVMIASVLDLLKIGRIVHLEIELERL